MTGGDNGPGSTAGSAPSGNLVRAATVDGTPIAEEMRARLDAAGITATVQAAHDPSDGAPLGGVMSTVDIMVPPGDLERARGIIEQVGREDDVQPDES